MSTLNLGLSEREPFCVDEREGLGADQRNDWLGGSSFETRDVPGSISSSTRGINGGAYGRPSNLERFTVVRPVEPTKSRANGVLAGRKAASVCRSHVHSAGAGGTKAKL